MIYLPIVLVKLEFFTTSGRWPNGAPYPTGHQSARLQQVAFGALRACSTWRGRGALGKDAASVQAGFSIWGMAWLWIWISICIYIYIIYIYECIYGWIYGWIYGRLWMINRIIRPNDHQSTVMVFGLGSSMVVSLRRAGDPKWQAMTFTGAPFWVPGMWGSDRGTPEDP